MAQHKLYSSPDKSPLLNSSISSGKSPGSKKSPREKQKDSNMKKAENNKPPKTIDNTNITQENSTREESDSDSMNESDFFSKCNMKLPYTMQEDEFILKYVLKGENIFKTSSLSLWKQLEYKKDNPKRTYQSLKNRFLRNIKPVIFTTYKHFVKDEEIAKKILSKYPELKNKYQKRETLSVVKVPSRPLQSSKETSKTRAVEENSVSSTSPSEITSNEKVQGRPSKPIFEPLQIPNNVRYIFGKGNYRDKIHCEKEFIRVTLDFTKTEKPKDPPNIQVYQRFLQLKTKNKVSRCEHCGRCDPKSVLMEDSDSDSDSDREGNLVIADSVGTPEKEISDKREERRVNSRSSSPVQPQKKRKKDVIQDDTCSPSLIDDHSQKDKGENGVQAPAKSGSKEEKSKGNPQSKNLDDFLSDKDLDSLYNETVANCRIFMDSDKEEEELNVSLRKSKNTFGFPPKISLEKANVEDFFLNSEPSSQVALPKISSTAKRRVNSDKEKKSPLAQNMVKMLRKGKKT